MAAGEVVLMYRLEGDRGRKLKTIFVQNGLRIRQIPREEYNQPIGALAGIKEIPRVEEVYDGDELAEEMMVFRGVYGKRLDLLLAQMRKNKVAVNLKAILTEHNVGWSGLQLYEELKKEHEQMHS